MPQRCLQTPHAKELCAVMAPIVTMERGAPLSVVTVLLWVLTSLYWRRPFIPMCDSVADQTP